MKALIYLTRRSLANNLKKATTKPSTLAALIFGTAYAVFLAVTLAGAAAEIRINSVHGLVLILTVWCIYVISGNFMMYSSRKGIIFRPAHSHFVFTAPVSPKLVLIHGAWMNYLLSAVVWVILLIAGMTVFQIPAGKAVLFFLTGCVAELALEISFMTLLYANERIPDRITAVFGFGIKVFMAAVTVLVILYFRKNGLTVESALRFTDWPVLQMIPVLGWMIAFFRLVLLGPAVLNVICSVLYFLTVAVAVTAAVRMKCEGGYYEDAAKFADDYAELKERKKNGEMVWGFGKQRKKLRRIRKTEGFGGAGAIFSRQMLEYKKEKFFFFDKITIISLIIAVIFSYGLSDTARETGLPQIFLLVVVAYMSFVMTGYTGKWERELQSPYLYLIPESAFRKMWYATLSSHIKALVDSCIICIPIGIFWHISAVKILYCIAIYTVLQADRIYTMVICQSLFGNTFGKMGLNMLRLLFQGILLSAGTAAAAAAGIFVNPDFIFPIVLIYSIMVTVAMGVLAAVRFETMEQLV